MLSAFGWKQFSLIGFGINGETIGFCWGRRGFIIERAGVERGFSERVEVQIYGLKSKLRFQLRLRDFTLELLVRCVVDSI